MTSAGQRRVLRVRNTRTDSWTWKAAGRDYYDHNRQRFIINIPCLGYIGPHVAGMEPTHGHDMNDPSDRADYERYGPVLLRSSFYGHFHSERIIPLTDAQVWVGTVPAEHEGNPNMAPEGPNLLDLANIGVIHDQDHDQATIEAALRTRVAEFLMNLPEFNTVDGRKHRLRVESTIIWMWDESKPITFDEQIIRNMHGEGPPLIETLMNRPLLGVPCVNERMYGRMGLCPIACLDLMDRGGCMVAQIVETVMDSKKKTLPGQGQTAGKKTSGGQKGGKDTRERCRKDERVWVQQTRFTTKQVEDSFDEIFQELYPGEAVSLDDVEAGLVEPQRAAPYEYDGWKPVGVTSTMCAAFCDRNKIGLRILYNNTVIFKNDVTVNGSGTHRESVIVYHICGDHAFFYDDKHVKQGASQLRQGPPKAIAKAEEQIRLRTRADEDDMVPFSDMVEFKIEAFQEQIQEDISKTFYCYTHQVKDIKKQIDEAGIPVWVGLGNRPEVIVSLNVCKKTKKEENAGKRHASEKKVEIRVRVVANEALLLQDYCCMFSEMNNRAKLIYGGQSISVVFMKALNVLCTSRRLNFPSEIRTAISVKQGCKCAICADPLVIGFELDHIEPLCNGGTNEATNLRAICKACHAEETNRLMLGGQALNDKSKFHTIESHMSPELWRDLHRAPKPVEVSYGIYQNMEELRAQMQPKKPKDGGKALDKKKERANKKEWGVKKLQFKAHHIRDSLNFHPKPQIMKAKEFVVPGGISELKCLDAKGCRVLALTQRARGLPVFCPLDEWEPFESRPLSDWDFVYVSLGDFRVHPGLFPYTGSRYYSAEVVEFLLEHHIVEPQHCLAGLRATRHVPSETLVKHFESLKAVCEHLAFESEPFMRAFQKRGILSMIGIWNATSQHAWKQTRSNYQVDAGHGLARRRQLDDGTFLWTTSTELIDLYSMAPWGRIALDVEQLRIAQAMRTLSQYTDEIRVAGAHVDGVFFLTQSFEASRLYLEIEQENKFPDGSPMFHLKSEPACKVPTWKQPEPERNQAKEFRKHEWCVVDESQIPNINVLVFLILRHQGMWMSGPAGVGKSTKLKELLPALFEQHPHKQLAMALRHCTCMLIHGKTISHYLHKYRRKGGAPAKGTVIFLDELSEVQLHTWVELARWKLVGVIFILVGDLDGQRKPIFDRWQDAMTTKDFRKSQILHELCGGLHVELSVYRRGTDAKLFERFTRLYAHADDDSKVAQVVAKCYEPYPYPVPDTERLVPYCDIYFVISHQWRMKINHAMNNYFAEYQTPPLLFIKSAGNQHGASMQSQDMLVWKGMELLCYSHRYQKNSPVTGAVYVVQAWDESTITVTLHDDYKGDQIVATPVVAEVVEEGEESDDEQLDVEDVGPKNGDKRTKDTYQLTHKRAGEILRLQHALVYASIQGRTMREQHIGLMDLENEHFTMRDLITAMSRPTHGKYLHFMTPEQQAKLKSDAEKVRNVDLKMRLLRNNREPSERPTPSRVGRF